MPRGKQEEDKGSEKPSIPKQTEKLPEIVQVPIEVPINMELLNQKLNLINQKLNLIPAVQKALETEEKAAIKANKK